LVFALQAEIQELRRFHRALVSCGLVLIILLASGCGSGNATVGTVAPSYDNLKILSGAYFQATQRNNRPPQSLDELMPFIKVKGDPSAVLRSPDDGQNYKILWGVDVGGRLPGGKYPVVAYEQQGKGGKRYVLEGHNVVHLTDAEFKKAPFPPGHKAPF
jgi:hypothetical protein